MKPKTLTTLTLIALAMAGTTCAAMADTVVNIDFLAQREGDAVTSPAPSQNATIEGAAGGGTTFNGLNADETSLYGTSEYDAITVSGSDLVDSYGSGTSEGFSIGPVGADNETGRSSGTLSVSSGEGDGGYLFVGSVAPETSASFTISGLGNQTSADLYFYTTTDNDIEDNAGTITLTSGTTATTYTADVGNFNSVDTIEFLDVPVVDGEITGSYNLISEYPAAVLSGLTVVTAGVPESVPEPSTWALLFLGGGALVWRLRRRSSSL